MLTLHPHLADDRKDASSSRIALLALSLLLSLDHRTELLWFGSNAQAVRSANGTSVPWRDK
jgi:hypothetical protein